MASTTSLPMRGPPSSQVPQHRHRRVVWMDADPDALTLSDRNHLFNEVGIVVPDLLDRELTTVGKRLVELGVAPDTYLVGARLIKLSRRSSPATPPDRCSRCHCSCGRTWCNKFRS